MTITVLRFHSTAKFTGGLLLVNNEPIGFTMEDEHRDIKIMHETRIPAGIYELKLRKTGGMHSRYSEKFKYHRGMLELQNVPGFSYIYIHIGNTEQDTSGCLLVGLNYNFCCNKITDSTKCYEKLYKRVIKAMDQNEQINVQIVDEMIYS